MARLTDAHGGLTQESETGPWHTHAEKIKPDFGRLPSMQGVDCSRAMV